MNSIEKWFFPPQDSLSTRQGNPSSIHPGLDMEMASYQALKRPDIACPLCAEKMPVAQVCGACLAAPPVYERLQVATYFDDTMARLVHRLKFGEDLAVSRLLAELMAESIELGAVQALVPVPLHPTRLIERGFNQSDELAKQLAKRFELPVLTQLVERVKATSPQATLTAKEREQNVKKAFAMDSLQGLEGIHTIAIVDDVVTTGATVKQVAALLKKVKPDLTIQVWAVAKAIQSA